MSYPRSSSPGGRRLGHATRLSDGYYPSAASAYTSPRSSGERVVPISTSTFVTRDAYSGRPRRSTLTEPSRPTAAPTQTTTTAHAHAHPRSRPAVIQSSHDRPQSPSSPLGYPTRSFDYYAVPASSSSSHKDHSHKKLYSIDGGGKSRLVADIDINTTHGSSHRRHSVDRNPTHPSSSHHRHKAYHLSGSSSRKPDPEQGYSYTDPAAMYRDTEPRWRHRQGSVEAARPRPTSAVIEQYPPRSSARDLGPPTSRALDKFNDGLGRGVSTRDPLRSSNRLSYQEPQYPTDAYPSSVNRHSAAVHQDHARDAYSRDVERARPKQRYEDHSVERRGFGIRSGSQDRYNHAMNRGSNESFDAYYSDRDYAPPRSEPRAYEHTQDPDRDRDYRSRDRDRLRDDGYTSERDRHHTRDRRDRDRRERDRDVTPRDSGDSLVNTILPAAATAAIGSLGAMAAAAYGSTDGPARIRERDHDYEDRDRDREKEREREREKGREREQRERERNHRDREHEQRERERERDRDIERESERERDKAVEREQRALERQRERERDTLRHESSSESSRDGRRSSRRHRNLAKDTSPAQDKDDERQRVPEPDRKYDSDERQRVAERDRPAPIESSAQLDPDEDYRRRMEQAQREISNFTEGGESDRERRTNGVDPILDRRMPPSSAAIVDNRESTTRENRVRIVEPPSDKEDSQPIKGILKKPTQQFPEHPNPVREGVAPLKEVR